MERPESSYDVILLGFVFSGPVSHTFRAIFESNNSKWAVSIDMIGFHPRNWCNAFEWVESIRPVSRLEKERSYLELYCVLSDTAEPFSAFSGTLSYSCIVGAFLPALETRMLVIR